MVRLVSDYLEAAKANVVPNWTAARALTVLDPDDAQEAMRVGGAAPEVRT
ncbi:hypothetical protein GCM10009734_97640 [Nonomuraea bangladeshensis]